MGKELKKLSDAIDTALRSSLAVKKGETLLVITDVHKRNIGIMFHEKAQKLKAQSMLVDIIPGKTDGEEPPEVIAKLMKDVDVLICPTSKSLTHTNARRAASKKGARTITLPGVTEEMLARAGNVDMQKMARITNKMTDILTIGSNVHITTPAGTDLRLTIKGKKGIADTGFVTEPGMTCNIPAGEAFLAPVEGSAEGILVVDGSMGQSGIIKKPIKMYVSKGFVTKILGNREARLLRKQLAPFGKMGRNIAEFGIGTNPKAKLTGKVLEDEKILGTIHIALGNNLTMGGTCDVGSHLDGILLRPKVTIDEKVILSGGKIRI